MSDAKRLPVRTLFCLVCLGLAAGYTAGESGDAKQGSGLKPEAVESYSALPAPLLDFWLRFHESELCLDLDAVFSFHAEGVEVWCVVEEERSYQRLSALIEPLRSAFKVDLYVTRPPPGKKPPEEKSPPPSLWHNEELNAYLSYSSRVGGVAGERETSDDVNPRSRVSVSKQRLILFAEQVLEWDRKIKRYGNGLTDLAQAGAAAGAPADVRRRALAVSVTHAQGLDRNAARLIENLAQALPKGSRKSQPAEKPAKPPGGGSAAEIAARLDRGSSDVAVRVLRFLHPRQHTVGLEDLRDPGLLDSLRSLRVLATNLQTALSRQP